MKTVKLEKLVKIASDAYPDGLIEQAYEGEDVGDGLATFIAEEIKEVVDGADPDDIQVKEAVRCLETAIHELEQVIKALREGV